MAELTVKSTTAADGTFSESGATAWNAGMAPDSGQLSVQYGGSGAASLTGLLQGTGTTAFTAVSNSSTVGQVLRVTGAATYAWGALDLSDTDAVTGTLPTANVTNLSGTNTGDQNLFGTISVSGQSDVVADTTADTLTLIAGSGMTITTNATNDSITFAASSSAPADSYVFRDLQFGGF